jgi:hypothetical protein
MLGIRKESGGSTHIDTSRGSFAFTHEVQGENRRSGELWPEGAEAAINHLTKVHNLGPEEVDLLQLAVAAMSRYPSLTTVSFGGLSGSEGSDDDGGDPPVEDPKGLPPGDGTTIRREDLQSTHDYARVSRQGDPQTD